jgi:CRP-like cAMP-binding protein
MTPSPRLRPRLPLRLRRRAAPDLTVLAAAPFDRYPARMLRPLTGHADRLRPAAGTPLAQEDGRADQYMVVLAGEVVVHRDGQPVDRLGPGTQLGATELLQGSRHSRTLVAGPDLEVLVVNGPAFRWAARTLPGLAAAVLAHPPTAARTPSPTPASDDGCPDLVTTGP